MHITYFTLFCTSRYTAAKAELINDIRPNNGSVIGSIYYSTIDYKGLSIEGGCPGMCLNMNSQYVCIISPHSMCFQSHMTYIRSPTNSFLLYPPTYPSPLPASTPAWNEFRTKAVNLPFDNLGPSYVKALYGTQVR